MSARTQHVQRGGAPANRRYDAIVFDVGGVLLDWNPVPVLARLVGDVARAEVLAARLLGDLGLFREMDLGTLSLEGARRRLEERYPAEHDAIRWIFEHWQEMVIGPIASNVALLHHYADQGYRVLGLTNWSDFGMTALMAQYAFFRRCEGVVISGRIRMAKPDPDIYRHLLQTYHLQAARCLFIDDNPAFVEGARAVGMDAVRFTTDDALRTDLQNRGLLDATTGIRQANP